MAFSFIAYQYIFVNEASLACFARKVASLSFPKGARRKEATVARWAPARGVARKGRQPKVKEETSQLNFFYKQRD
jgi:hypothetical protein